MSERIIVKEFLVDGPAKPDKLFILAHGAGKGMASPFMDTVAKGVAQAGVRVVRFHFPYMEEMVRTGKRRPPNGGRILRACYSELITHCIEKEGCPRSRIIIGGKSMGGRIASMIADEQQIAGVVCLGYPFHPPRKPDVLRTEHLKTLTTPTLICQGERDPFGGKAEGFQDIVSTAVRFHWLADGNHNFTPRKQSGHSEEGNLQEAIRAVRGFIQGL